MEQMKLRENAIAQTDMLMEYKRIITHHSSHLQSKKLGTEGGLLSVFVSLLAEPLSKTGTYRTNTDHLTIELVLHLFRNLLSAETLLGLSTEITQNNSQLHQELIALFDAELVFEILFILAQEMESRENANYNLLLMEMLHHLLKNQDPSAVAKSGKQHAVTMAGTKKENPPHGAMSGILKQTLMREKSKFLNVTPSRHGHFGGTLVVHQSDGKRRYVSASSLDQGTASLPPGAKKRKNRKHEPFVGSSQKRVDGRNPTSVKAQQTLHKFCERFVKDCYGPMIKSLKNEFRRDSVRLEEGDKIVFFRIVWFFNQWWRVSGKKQLSTSNTTILGQLIFSMDLFMFNLVLTAVDEFVEKKKYPQLAGAVALFSEQMHLLHEMNRSKDNTERSMSLGLLHQLFYKKMESIDRLPKLISNWAPGISSREYLCDLVEVVHLSLKLLEANARHCKDPATDRAVAKMQVAASEFDLNSYVARKVITNNTIVMYTHLLSHYIDNPVHVNHHIIAFFLRVCNVKLFIPEEIDDETPINPLAPKIVTLEPILYNIQMILVLNNILNDQSIRKDNDFSNILAFATHIVFNMSKAANQNPLVFVEALFRHAHPGRYCEMISNLYVNEELRMIAERELLMEEQSRVTKDDEELEGEADNKNDAPTPATAIVSAEKSPFIDSDDEDEVEWDGAGVEEGCIEKHGRKRLRRIKTKVPTNLDSSDDDELEIDLPVQINTTHLNERDKDKAIDENRVDNLLTSCECNKLINSGSPASERRVRTEDGAVEEVTEGTGNIKKSNEKVNYSDDEDLDFDTNPDLVSMRNVQAMLNYDSDNE